MSDVSGLNQRRLFADNFHYITTGKNFASKKKRGQQMKIPACRQTIKVGGGRYVALLSDPATYSLYYP